MSAHELPARGHRPVAVTVAVALIYIGGLFSILVGVLLLLARYAPDVGEAGGPMLVSLIGVSGILAGLLTIAVASGVARGSRLSRGIVTVVLGLSTVLGLAGLFSAPSDLWTEWLELGLNAFVLSALWLRPGSRFFR